MSTIFIVVRHGQTAWNKEERFRGRTDLPLDETGQWQAGAAARRIAARYRPAAILASPLQRTMQTASPIAEACGLTAQADDRLLDLDYGDFSGLRPSEAETLYPQIYRTWVEAPHLVRFPQGESLDEVRARVEELTGQMLRHHPDQQIILVSHLVVCRVLLCSLLGLPNSYFWRFQVDPASLSVVAIDGERARLVTANDTCHLSV
jgi:broad specificity phosphatase PhoE